VKPVLERELWAGSNLDAIGNELLGEDGLAPPPREDRHQVELTGYLIRSDKRIVDVKIVDLSYDGCGVRTLVPLIPGERLKLSVLGRGAVAAVVRWHRSRKAGLLFLPDRAPRPRWPRKAERVQVNGEVSLRRSGRISYRVTAVDMTRFGCKCEFVERPSIYERVFVKFDGLESLEAVVCWIEESSLGLMFKTPMHPAVFDMLLMRLGPRNDAHELPADA
jgi:hypothetical protein